MRATKSCLAGNLSTPQDNEEPWAEFGFSQTLLLQELQELVGPSGIEMTAESKGASGQT
jgi:hypothetical protein